MMMKTTTITSAQSGSAFSFYAILFGEQIAAGSIATQFTYSQTQNVILIYYGVRWRNYKKRLKGFKCGW